MKKIYMDYAATTPVRSEVLGAMLPYFSDAFGNPSSVHSCGQSSRQAVEDARAQLAVLIGCVPDEIIFTSGGSEADNHALKGVAGANRGRGNHIITTAIEHHAVLETCRFLAENGYEVTYLPVNESGLVDPQAVQAALTPRTTLVSIMLANNEVGTIEPIEEIAAIVSKAGVYFHTDAVQAAGHIPIDVNRLGVDLLSLSGHKLYGPKGIGALYIRRGTRIDSFIHGGGQEKGRRAGTENVPSIVGLGKAAELARQELSAEMVRLSLLRDRLVSGILNSIEYVKLNGHPVLRLPNNVNISVEGAAGEALLLNLDMEGICVSTGSACSTTTHEPSHVLTALGIPAERAHSSLRMTLGHWTTAAEIDRVLEVLPSVVSKLRAMSPLMPNGFRR
jgi:cysteine desulfurase